MRRFFLSLGAVALVASAALAQTASDGSNMPQLPVGQTFKLFEFPVYQDGKLKYKLAATEAKGITLNRAETSDLKIEVYDEAGKTTTTITSPKADLYVAEQKMRTKNTVQIERDDMEATSQDADFDVKLKKFVLRTNVKVTLKHFDVGSGSLDGTKSASTSSTPAPVPAPAAPNAAALPSATPAAPTVLPAPSFSSPAQTDESILPSPGAFSETNSAPIPPSK